MRVLPGTLPAEGRRWISALDPARTRVMLLLALACAAAAIAAVVFPPSLAVLFCLLLGPVCTLPLRLPALHSLAAGPAAAVVLCAGRAVVSGLALDPGTTAPAAAGATAGGMLLLEACSLAALWAARSLGRSQISPFRRSRPLVAQEPAILEREAGLERLEWEVARAAAYRRPLTLCLLGLDPDRGEGSEAADLAALRSRMRRVDQLLLRDLSRFESAAECGPSQRLLLLPELWADGYMEAAGELCARAAGRTGRTVRAALVTFPFDGTRSEGLLADLEQGLQRCRERDALVSVGAVAREAASLADFAS